MVEDTRRGNKVLSLGPRLSYPIRITKIYKSRGDKIKKQQPILQYAVKSVVEEGDSVTGEYKKTEKDLFMEWPSSSDGTLVSLHVKIGDLIASDRKCMTIEEPCSHEVQFQGLCAMCGADMTEVNWATDRLDTERAPVNMTHDQTKLLVSQNAAAKAELELQKRLLDQRKLSLVVDLDQTIIHACIEPTIGDWQRDPSNPNHEAVKDVRSFQLNDDGPRGLASGCWYYIKMRPGLKEFLEHIAEMYELHVYTMGTRAYAENIAKIVDPDKKLFGNRVISRDENGNMAAKTLQRIFPVSTNMVAIIDDRADVWPRNRPNLIKVVPYDFFKGIGDINSSFLPKREDLVPSSSSAPAATANAKLSGPVVNGSQKPQSPEKKAVNGAASPDSKEDKKASALEESSGDDAALIKKQTEEQEKTLAMQIQDRPLLHMQEQLDRQDEQAASKDPVTAESDGAAPSTSEPGASTASGAAASAVPPTSHQRHHLLYDDDHELEYLEKHLTTLHREFYRAYDNAIIERKAEYTVDAQIKGLPQPEAKKQADSKLADNPPDPPDAGEVLDELKAKVLGGTRIALSGLVPVGMDVEQSEIGLQAKSFGAQIMKRVTKHVTHLVISSGRPRTMKVTQAERIPSIKIVNQDWLIHCFSQWKHLDETPYIMKSRSGAALAAAALAAAGTDNTDADTVSDGDTDAAAGSGSAPSLKRKAGRRLKIVVSPPDRADNEDGDDSDDEDEGTDGGDGDDDKDDFMANGATSPIDELKTFDWGSADAEMADFLAGDDDDDDSDSVSNVSAAERSDADNENTNSEAESVSRPSRGKRKLSNNSVDSSLKRQRLGTGTPRSGSRLRVVRTPDDMSGNAMSGSRGNGGSLPTPQGTGDEEDGKENGPTSSLPVPDGETAADGVSDIDEELEADLMAELEAEELEEAELEGENG